MRFALPKLAQSDEALYDLTFTLAGRDSVLEDKHVEICTKIWRDDEPHRPWLAAAMLRRCDVASDDLDEATARFVCQRLLEDFGLGQEIDSDELRDSISAMVLLIPDDGWTEPTALWHLFLQVVVTELTLPRVNLPEAALQPKFQDVPELASFFADALGGEWDAALEDRLQGLIRRGYRWLAGVRHAIQIDEGIRQLQQTRLAGSPPPSAET